MLATDTTIYEKWKQCQKLSASGIIGITLIPETLKTWAYSLHACNTVVSNLDQKRTQEQHVPAYQTHPKEEAKARVNTDTKDRKALRDKLEV